MTDPKPGSESSRPLTPSRQLGLTAAGLAGGAVGALGVGLVGVLIGAELAGSRWDDASGGMLITGLGVVGAFLGLPLGIAIALRAAGAGLGIRVRLSPLLVASYCAWIAFLVGWLLMVFLRLHQVFPFVSAAIGGLLGYLLSSRIHHDSGSGDP